MVDLSLRGQYDEAARLLRLSRPADARDVCLRILEAFPRHVATYALLGHAYARLGRREEAANLFARVLAADPESCSAHTGLAAICERRGDTERALWHYQVACDVAPGDPDSRAGYLRVRGLVDGHVPHSVRLSRAGLARAYGRGRLYDLAVREYGELLSLDPERFDLRVGLAEMLWRAHRTDEAAAVCQDLLTRLPNCLKAGLILGQVWLGTDRDAFARTLLGHAQTLDPDNAVAQDLFGEQSPLPPRSARLPFREQDVPPLDLDYLLDADDLAEPAPDVTVSAAPRRPRKVRPEAAEPSLPHEPAESAGVDAMQAEAVDAEAASAEPDRQERAPWETMTLVDVQRQYVAEHPDDARARLDLAQRLRDDGRLYEALEQYRWLVTCDVLLLPQVMDDLEFLNRMYPRTPQLHELLSEARFRESRGPSHSG